MTFEGYKPNIWEAVSRCHEIFESALELRLFFNYLPGALLSYLSVA